MRTLKSRYLLGAATLALCMPLFGQAAAADDTLGRVLERLEKLERENAKLRSKVGKLEESKGGGATSVKAGQYQAIEVPEGRAIALAPKSAVDKETGKVKGSPVWMFGENTTLSIYGHANLSFDGFNNQVFNQGAQYGLASNLSFIGFRAKHNLESYGYPGMAVVLQYEEQVDVSATPTERASFGSRDSFLGMETPYGNIKAGKVDTPYKKASAKFDPFSTTIADYNSIMGNTGGDNRAEFDFRLSHSIWYESPEFHGFQFSALFSPGQNIANDNSDFAYGEFLCTASNSRANGSGFPAVSSIGVGCTDGSFGDAFSIGGSYVYQGLTVIGGYELHKNTNRNGDNLVAPDPVINSGVKDEWAVKAGASYDFNDGIGPISIAAYYEIMRRKGADPRYDERSRDGVFASVTQEFDKNWSASFSYAHAFKTPGSPAVGTAGLFVNNASATQFDANLFSNAASQYNAGVKYKFNKYLNWYLVGAYLQQDPGAHYCLGASGHGYQVCSRDPTNNNTIGGTTITAVSSGLNFDF